MCGCLAADLLSNVSWGSERAVSIYGCSVRSLDVGQFMRIAIVHVEGLFSVCSVHGSLIHALVAFQGGLWALRSAVSAIYQGSPNEEAALDTGIHYPNVTARGVRNPKRYSDGRSTPLTATLAYA